MRLAGVLVPSMVAGEVTAEALSSIETCIRSLGSRTRNTSVSTIFLGSVLKEYCTVENIACTENSRRMRTQLATPGSEDICEPDPGCRNPGPTSRLDLPRSISKSAPNSGSLGTAASAEAISRCSSAEGVHTFRTFTLTWGCDACCALASELRPNESRRTRLVRSTLGF